MSRIQPPPTSQAQLDLFMPRPNVPRWNNLPLPVRQRIETQLAALLRQHATRLSNGKDANDERKN